MSRFNGMFAVFAIACAAALFAPSAARAECQLVVDEADGTQIYRCDLPAPPPSGPPKCWKPSPNVLLCNLPIGQSVESQVVRPSNCGYRKGKYKLEYVCW